MFPKFVRGEMFRPSFANWHVLANNILEYDCNAIHACRNVALKIAFIEGTLYGVAFCAVLDVIQNFFIPTEFA